MIPEQLQIQLEALEALVQSGNDLALVETQARELLDSLSTEEGKGVIEIKVRILLVLARSLSERGMAREALTFGEEALSHIGEIQSKSLQANIWNNLGHIYSKLSDYPIALEYLEKALVAYADLDNQKNAAGVAGNIGIVYRHLSDFPRALEYMEKSLTYNKGLGNMKNVAKMSANIGIVYRHLSDYSRALEYYQQALALAEQLNMKQLTANCTGSIGVLYNALGDYATALEYYHKALAHSEALGDKSGMATWIGNLGNIYADMGEFPLAIESYHKALAHSEALGDKSGMARHISNIGLAYFEMADISRVFEYYQKSLALEESMGNTYGIATTHFNIGILYAKTEFEQYDASKAEEYLLKSLAMLTELNVKHELYQNHKVLAELYENESRWTDALYHFKKFYDLEKEVQSEETQKQAQKFGYERKIAEQEKRIAIERAETQARLDEQQKLLHNVLPPIIADRLLRNETFIADSYPSVSVLFMDLVGFTRIAAIIPPRHLIYVLNTIFSNADAVMEKHGLEKIKTIGDAYMAVAGAPIAEADHATRAALASLELLDSMNNLSINIPSELGSTSWIESVGEINVRIGLHIGEAIGGVIGDKKFSFDLWGDAVNTAARMESHGETGRIHVSEAFMRAATEHSRSEVVKTGHALSLHTATFSFSPRGEMEIKGKGKMKTFFLERAE